MHERRKKLGTYVTRKTPAGFVLEERQNEKKAEE